MRPHAISIPDSLGSRHCGACTRGHVSSREHGRLYHRQKCYVLRCGVACGGQATGHAAPPLRAAAAFLAAGAAHENTGFRPLLIFGLNVRACFPQFTQRACTARGALGDRSGRTRVVRAPWRQVEVVAWSATFTPRVHPHDPTTCRSVRMYVSLRRRSRTHA